MKSGRQDWVIDVRVRFHRLNFRLTYLLDHFHPACHPSAKGIPIHDGALSDMAGLPVESSIMEP